MSYRRSSRSSADRGERNVSFDQRAARHSTGVKEEFLAPEEGEKAQELSGKDPKMLAIYFGLMVFIGLGNKIFNKLMTIPMHNYPNFLNLLTTSMYVPVCFAYVIPMARIGKIPQEQLDLPYKPFAVMGGLDAIAGIMQVFAATYLPGPIIILMSQSAIPISMVISRYLINARYDKYQYAGATIVAVGIVVVLAPTITGGGSALWAIVMMLSCVPMTLSSVYKEISLGATELDPMYLNGMISVFQFLFSLLLCVPSSLASDPPVPIPDLPQNLMNGLKCYMGISSKTCQDDEDDGDCSEDNCMPNAPMFVTIYLVFNQLYNLLIILILKYGSANILWLAMTLMVPLGNVAFTLPFVPEHSGLRPTDIVGLVVICAGLGVYRFLSDYIKSRETARDRADSASAKEPLLDLVNDVDRVISVTGEDEESRR
mmetsp:Transcript_6269/g.13291  ORF Transcript_6269/g.13291 Transcript_6269/m.13291 type:complete len:428 (-) Transcript_6269:140-1423(-)